MASDDAADFRAQAANPLAPAAVDGTFSGGAGAFELAFGGTPSPGLVLGGGIYASGAGQPKQDVTVQGRPAANLPDQIAQLAVIGPFVDYYFDPKGGWHVQGALGFASVVIQRADSSNNDPRVGKRDQIGFGVMLGGGYDAWVSEQWSLGGSVRFLYGSTSTNDDANRINYSGIAAPELLFTVTYH